MDIDALIDDLRRDLIDGDDLATALSLIGDTLHRRIRRTRRSLELISEADDVVSEEWVERVRATLERFEDVLERRHAEVQEAVTEYQDQLDDFETELPD